MSSAPRTGTDWLKAQRLQVTDGSALAVSAKVAATVEVEAWLQKHNVQYAGPIDIPMFLIDEKRSRGNQARRDPIVSESVDRFAAALRSGAVFPPIVVYASGSRLVIIDGNNRQAAHRKAGSTSISGILIADDTPSELIQLLTVEANAHHGVTPDFAWRILQAFQLCSLGFSDGKAAEACAVTVAQLRGARAAQEADQRARVQHIAGFETLPQAAKQRLAALRDDAVFYQASRLALDTGMTCDEVRDMTREVKQLPSEGARLEAVSRIAVTRGIERSTRRATGKPATRVTSAKQGLATGIGKILAVDEVLLARQVLTRHDREQLTSRVDALEQKIRKLRFALESLTTIDEEL